MKSRLALLSAFLFLAASSRTFAYCAASLDPLVAASYSGEMGSWTIASWSDQHLVAIRDDGQAFKLNAPSGTISRSGKLHIGQTSFAAEVYDNVPIDPRGDGHGVGPVGDGLHFYLLKGDKPVRKKLHFVKRSRDTFHSESVVDGTFLSEKGKYLVVPVEVEGYFEAGPGSFYRVVFFDMVTGDRVWSYPRISDDPKGIILAKNPFVDSFPAPEKKADAKYGLITHPNPTGKIQQIGESVFVVDLPGGERRTLHVDIKASAGRPYPLSKVYDNSVR